MEITKGKITGEVKVPEEILKEVKNISQFKIKIEDFLTPDKFRRPPLRLLKRI